MTGTPNQVEWAERIKMQVSAEFDRAADVFRQVAARQPPGPRQTDTHVVLAILEEKRQQILAHEEAGYYIKGWQELGDQVRQLIRRDPRFEILVARRREVGTN